VPQGVVDQLEAVEVEEQHRERGPGALAAVDRRGEPLQEQPPVGQAGQCVVQRAAPDLLLQPAGLERRAQQPGPVLVRLARRRRVHRSDQGEQPPVVAAGAHRYDDADLAVVVQQVEQLGRGERLDGGARADVVRQGAAGVVRADHVEQPIGPLLDAQRQDGSPDVGAGEPAERARVGLGGVEERHVDDVLLGHRLLGLLDLTQQRARLQPPQRGRDGGPGGGLRGGDDDVGREPRHRLDHAS
jgi:hypothetical protein